MNRSLPKFPKPKQVRRPRPAVKVYPGGREVCQDTPAGSEEYKRRRRVAWEEQGGTCCIGKEPLRWEDATTEHFTPRGMGAGSRDDRQENIGAACQWHNSAKGSKRVQTLD